MTRHIALTAGIVGLFLFALTGPALAEDKEVTITGEGKCAKCILKEGDECQTVIETQVHGKSVKYYVANNKIGKKFNDTDVVCEKAQKVTATGTVKDVDGKKVLTPTKIALAKD